MGAKSYPWFSRMRVTRNRTRRSGCLIVGHACRAAPRVASLFVLIHICTTVRTGAAKLHATGGFGRCVRRHSRMPAHLSRTCAVRAACTLSSAYMYSCARAACPPVPRARLSDMRARPIRSSFKAARATCVASPLSRAQVACPSRPAFSSRKLLPLLAALLASPIFIFSLCARLSCAV